MNILLAILAIILSGRMSLIACELVKNRKPFVQPIATFDLYMGQIYLFGKVGFESPLMFRRNLILLFIPWVLFACDESNDRTEGADQSASPSKEATVSSDRERLVGHWTCKVTDDPRPFRDSELTTLYAIKVEYQKNGDVKWDGRMDMTQITGDKVTYPKFKLDGTGRYRIQDDKLCVRLTKAETPPMNPAAEKLETALKRLNPSGRDRSGICGRCTPGVELCSGFTFDEDRLMIFGNPEKKINTTVCERPR